MQKILIVDDSATSRAIASRFLSDAYEVSTASDGGAAQRAIETGDFDLVFLDLLMPGLDGWYVLDWMRSSGWDVPVVAMTADIQASTRTRLMELGAAGVVNKPLTREKLTAAMEAAWADRLGAAS